MKKQFLYILITITIIISGYLIVSDNKQNKEIVKSSAFINTYYGEDPLQRYDIFLPENRSTEKTKVIVFIHGGGWTNGDKDNTDKMVRFLRKQHPNHAIATINYRLASPNPPVIPAFPNQFLDVGLVLDDIESQKEIYQILPEFGLIGTSAGSHLALMYDYVYDKENRVKMVCSIVGPTNLTSDSYTNNPNFNLYSSTLIDKKAYPETNNYIEAVSPLFQVSSKSSPTLLFYGDQDKKVPLSNGVQLKEALNNVSVLNKLIVFNGGHGDYWSENFKKELSDFINLNLAIKE